MVAQRSDIERRVRQVVVSVLNVEPQRVQDDSNFVFDLGADSRQSVELVAAFEEEFDIEMDQDKALAVQTVGDAVDFIAATVNG